MKSIIKDILFGMLFAALVALLVFTVDEITIAPIPTFALLASLAICVMIPKPYISFAFLTAVCVGVSLYDVNYVVYCFPAAMLVWSASLCKEEKVSPVYIALAQIGFAVSLCFCFINRTPFASFVNLFIKMNKLVFIPIVILAFIILQNVNFNTDSVKKYDDDYDDYDEEDEEDDEDEEEDEETVQIEKSKRILMICAYAWSIVFLLDMAIRFQTTVNVTLLWICAMCYVVAMREPLLMNTFPALEKMLKSRNDLETDGLTVETQEEQQEKI